MTTAVHGCAVRAIRVSSVDGVCRSRLPARMAGRLCMMSGSRGVTRSGFVHSAATVAIGSGNANTSNALGETVG